MPIRIAPAFILLLALHVPAAAQSARSQYPILGVDGTRVLNHAIAPELNGAAERMPGAVTVGNPRGDVTLVEFYDLNCPYCRRASDDVDAILREDRELKLVLVPFPVLGVASILAGRVELAVAKIASADQFYRFHRRIYAGRGVIDGNRALATARELKLDERRLLEIADTDDITETMKAHVRLGNALGLVATPSFVIGGVAIVGHPGRDNLQKIVGAVRRCGKVVC